MNELKPCPFCGGKMSMTYSSFDNMFHFYHRGKIVRCYAKEPIDFDGDYVHSLKEAAEAWNRRANDEQIH